jgi:hypothetical protein
MVEKEEECPCTSKCRATPQSYGELYVEQPYCQRLNMRRAQQLQNIPTQLTEHRQWMGARFEPRAAGGLNKPPYCVRRGRHVRKADKRNPDNWASFEEALEALETGAVDAIGLVITGNDRLCLLDLDGAIHADTGELDEWASDTVEAFETYWEVSCSGQGLHGIFIGHKPGNRCKRDGFEIYDGQSGARFVVITGDAFDDEEDTDNWPIRNCQAALEELYRRLWPERGDQSNKRTRGAGTSLTDEELLKRARNARSGMGERFKRLYDQGDRTGFESPSHTDFSLINALIFWTSGDRNRVAALFQKSALYRPPPQKHSGYVERSVDAALASYKGPLYQPKALRQKATPEADKTLAPYMALLLDPAQWRGKRGASAFKAYAGAIIHNVEHGISTDNGELRSGLDVRTLAEISGMKYQTLCESALPYLITEKKLLTWQRGRGKRAGELILRKPEVPAKRDTKGSTEAGHFNVPFWGESLRALEALIRMRGGRSKFALVARLGMVAMFVAVALLTSPRGTDLERLVEATGRRKDHVRNAARKLVGAGVVESPCADFYRLSPDFLERWERELARSGITYTERRQREKHREQRKRRDENWRAKKKEPVVELHPSMGKPRRRRKPGAKNGLAVVQISARLRDSSRARTPADIDRGTREVATQAELQRDYDERVARCMERLEQRGATREKAEVAALREANKPPPGPSFEELNRAANGVEKLDKTEDKRPRSRGGRSR